MFYLGIFVGVALGFLASLIVFDLYLSKIDRKLKKMNKNIDGITVYWR